MLRHIVLFKFKKETTESDIKKIEKAFGELPAKVPVIKDYEWGLNNSPENLDKGFTHCFLLTFENESDRTTYLPHPAHKTFKALVEPYLEDVLVFDYKVNDLDILTRQIKSKDARKRMNAIDALGEIGSKDAITALVTYLDSSNKREVSSDSSIEKAIYALGRIGDLSVIPFLIDLLRTNPAVNNNNNLSSNGRALIKTLVELYAEEAIPTIITYLNHKNPILREESIKALEGFDWKPNHLQNKIRWLSAKKDWDAIIAIGPMMTKPLMSLTSNPSVYAYEKLMLALAKIGDKQAISHILLWLFKPYYHFHKEKQLTNLEPFLKPLFGELTTAILEASSFINCMETQERLSSYSLETAIKATQSLKMSNLLLAKKVLEYIPLKKPVELVKSKNEEDDGNFIRFDFIEQIDTL